MLLFLLVFAGHTDVVPPGPEKEWSSPPFKPTIKNNKLYGRGAADMKTSLAAFIVSIEEFLTKNKNHKGSLEIGKYADFVVLSNDITTCKEEEVLKTSLLRTFIDGEEVYKN